MFPALLLFLLLFLEKIGIERRAWGLSCVRCTLCCAQGQVRDKLSSPAFTLLHGSGPLTLNGYVL
jgi:hypothetical protein